MPGFDGTGPRGQGPMTGGGRGFCAVPFTGQPGFGVGRGGGGLGRGFGFGWGRGRGFGSGRGLGRGRRWDYPYGAGYYGAPYGDPYAQEITPQQEAAMLKEQAKAMQEEIAAINERISTLEKSAVEEQK